MVFVFRNKEATSTTRPAHFVDVDRDREEKVITGKVGDGTSVGHNEFASEA